MSSTNKSPQAPTMVVLPRKTCRPPKPLTSHHLLRLGADEYATDRWPSHLELECRRAATSDQIDHGCLLLRVVLVEKANGNDGHSFTTTTFFTNVGTMIPITPLYSIFIWLQWKDSSDERCAGTSTELLKFTLGSRCL